MNISAILEIIPIIKDLTPSEMILFILVGVIVLYLKFSRSGSLARFEKILLIKYHETLYEQMSVLEVKHSLITMRMIDIFRSFGPTKQECKLYSKQVYIMEHSLKSIIRKWFKENHYTSRTPEEFSSYIEEKILFIINFIGQQLDDDFEEYSISREKLKEANYKELVPYVTRLYNEVFYAALKTAQKNEKRIKKLQGKKNEDKD